MTADLEKVRKAWESDIEGLEANFDEVMLHLPRRGAPASKQYREALQRYWAGSSHLLYQYVKTFNQFGVYLEPMPMMLLARLGHLSDELGRGLIPSFVEDSRSTGGRPMRTAERIDIAKAVYFLQGVSEGVIRCSSPTLTVARNFNVTSATVRNWKARAEEITKNVPEPHPNMLQEAMEHAGIKYSVRGRGAPSSWT